MQTESAAEVKTTSPDAYPAATPPDVVKRMEAELREALKSPAVQQRLGELGALPAGGGAKELADFVSAETTKWAGVIKSSNIKLD